MSDMNTFEIRTYGRTELAQLYCHNLCPESAYLKVEVGRRKVEVGTLGTEVHCFRLFRTHVRIYG